MITLRRIYVRAHVCQN